MAPPRACRHLTLTRFTVGVERPVQARRNGIVYPRMLEAPAAGGRSFFLFGPRGTGKTTWIKQQFPNALYLDLLDHALYLELLTRPQRLREMIPARRDDWIVLDEVQRVPLVLNEVHRLIETDQRRFILTGSSARSLRAAAA